MSPQFNLSSEEPEDSAHTTKEDEGGGNQLNLFNRINWNDSDLKDALLANISDFLLQKGERQRGVRSIDDVKISAGNKRNFTGTKSSNYHITVEFTREGRRESEVETFFLKQYNEGNGVPRIFGMPVIPGNGKFLGLPILPYLVPDEDKELERERAIFKFTGKYVGSRVYPDLTSLNQTQIFPRILRDKSGAFKKRRQLLLELIREETLEEKVSREGIAGLSTLSESLNPVVLLHEMLPAKIAKYKDYGGSELDQIIKRIDDRDVFTPSILKYLELLGGKHISGTQKYELEKVTSELISPLANPSDKNFFITTIQKDGYPFHNMFVSLIDGGSVVYGHRALHLGCLLGHPGIYNKLPVILDNLADTSGERVASRKKENLSRLISSYLSKCRLLVSAEGLDRNVPDKKEITEEFFKTTLLGGVFGNCRIAARIRSSKHHSDESVVPYLNAIEDQLKYFGETGERFRQLSRISYFKFDV